MEREIKFRGKRIDNGEWVYGSYTQMREDDHNECFRAKPHKAYHRIWQWEAGDWNMGGYANYEVIPETVCQWTGLLDKQGSKIFEGDILKTDDGDIVEVRYEKIYASFGLWKKGWSFLHYFHEAVEPQCCEIIGNIHDDLSLLNSDKED